tara:strand:- start:494 stop:769 length:276 start_codon:yes stop_codon:yes gene_type:complete
MEGPADRLMVHGESVIKKMLFQYDTKKLSKDKLDIFESLFKMWCRDNDVLHYDSRIVGNRLKLGFHDPEDVLKFKMANGSMWNQIDLSYTD